MPTYYIATTGNDTTGDGSSGNPWATISKAHTSAASGDTIIVNDGTYTMASQAFTKNLTVQAANNLGAVFDGGGATLQWYSDTASLTISISGIRFTNAVAGITNDGGFIGPRNGSTNNWSITKCQFDVITIANYAVGGIIHMGNRTGVGGTISVVSCLFFDNTQILANHSVFSGRTDGGGLYPTLNITNCTYYNDIATASAITNILSPRCGYTVALKNLIVMDTTTNTINIGTQTANPDPISGSITYSCLRSPSGSINTFSLTTSNNITSDPLFVDAANNNFNLRPTSPGIDAGVIL